MTIINFLDMINTNEFEVKINIIEKNDSYCFHVDEIPEDLFYCLIDKFDVPCYFNPNYQPIEVLIGLENFGDYEAFKKEFSLWLV